MNPNLHGPSVLIVEDDEGHAVLIQQNLADAGFDRATRHFSNGQAFLDYLLPAGVAGGGGTATEPYLIVLDIRMPKVDGIEVLRRLKRNDELRMIPVVMFTTSDDERDVDTCYRLGCSAYIRKPIEYDQFADAVHRIGSFAQLLIVPWVASR